MGVGLLQADEVVTSIFGGAEDGALAWGKEQGGGMTNSSVGTVGLSESMRQTAANPLAKGSWAVASERWPSNT